ncbi:DUF7666 domain-containing protein [Brooklawnia cerclae]|uniref:DUF7666 domain-containing protein n=1 Tax=Brooklawnia cerclae TaxID=349934 RepID=UPI0035E6545A
MSIITVTTQEELDKAFAEHGDDIDTTIVIKSPPGTWLTVSQDHSATVEASDSATVRASGSATVEASGSATVRAWDSATVEASDSATVEASGSATVRAWDSATVEASGSATVRAWDSATVEASDSATVEASGSATVRAWDSATVEASDSATVEASGSATVRAGKYVAVHRQSKTATVTGGVVIDTTDLDPTNIQDWLDYTGVTVDEQGLVHLYKAVDDNLTAGHNYVPTVYPIGGDVTPDEWRDNHQCGYGLHASPTPAQAHQHFWGATRFLEVTCPVADLRPIDWSKAKVPLLHVLREVDINGNEIIR